MIDFDRNIPNFLTTLRILLIPFYLYSFSSYYYFLAFFIFFVASITDIYDGYLARKYNYVSNFGSFLDPFADKLLVISSLVIFLYNPIVIEYNTITKYMVFIIVFRDIFVTLLRIFLRHNGVNMVTSYFSKVKTSGQIIIIYLILLFLIIHEYTSIDVSFLKDYHILYSLSYIITIITLLSGIDYFVRNIKRMN